jgi:hypothetical protein
MSKELTQKQKFEQKAKGLTRSIVSMLGNVTHKQESLRVSINELGAQLVKLQGLAKSFHQPFSSVVESAPISLPRRTAYRYIALYESAASSGVSALVEQAGFDPAQARIVKKINKLGIKKVRRMSSIQLAEKLEKGAEKQNPRTLFLRALKAYTKYLIREGGYDHREIQSRLEQMIEKSVTPSSVRKAA